VPPLLGLAVALFPVALLVPVAPLELVLDPLDEHPATAIDAATTAAQAAIHRLLLSVIA
jgi:hypothetical protein